MQLQESSSYSPNAFEERVTSMLQRIQSLPYACAFVALFACEPAQWIYTNIRSSKAHTHTHKAVAGRVESKKLLSHQRQSDYRCFVPEIIMIKL